MKSRSLTGFLIVSIFSVAIPAIAGAEAIHQTDRTLAAPDLEPLAAGQCPTTSVPKDRRPKTVKDRWRSPHRNLSTTS